MELSVGKRIRCIDTQKEGIVVDFLTKEETKECKMFGQLVRIQLNNRRTLLWLWTFRRKFLERRIT